MAEETITTESNLLQVKHSPPILPPEEGYTEEDVLAFDRKLRESIGEKGFAQYTVQPKIQGIAVRISYESGVLCRAATIGNGYEGEIITDNIKTILTVPLTLWRIGDAPPFPERLEVRGGVYMERADLEELNRERKEKGQTPFQDVRQGAQDSLRQMNPRISARRPLNMFCYEVGDVEPSFPVTSLEMMVLLQAWGFRVNRPHIRVCDGPDDLIKACRAIREKEFPYSVEGALIQFNRLDFGTPEGARGNVPARAFVFRG